MSRVRPEPGTLAAAALALEEEIGRLEAVVREAARPALTSGRAVEQCAARLGEIAGADERLQPFLDGLTAALGALADRQRALGAAVGARAAEIVERRAALATLLERHEALRRGAAEANGVAGQLAESLGRSGAFVDLVPLAERVGALLEDARALSAAAIERGFVDVERDAHALAQMLLAMKNKLQLLGASGGAASS